MPDIQDCGLLIVDIQGKLARTVRHSEEFIAQTAKLIKCCKVLSLPIIAFEQNPSGLGPTVPELASLLEEAPFYEKNHFSLVGEDSIKEALHATGKRHWIVAGIEAHICVYQSVKDLINEGYAVDVASDCISSRSESDLQLAIANMRHLGAHITSVEMCVYELMKSSKNSSFKDVLKVIK